jgi:hypothetical protein
MNTFKQIQTWQQRARADGFQKSDLMYMQEEIESLRTELQAHGLLDQPMKRSTGFYCATCFARQGEKHEPFCNAVAE